MSPAGVDRLDAALEMEPSLSSDSLDDRSDPSANGNTAISGNNVAADPRLRNLTPYWRRPFMSGRAQRWTFLPIVGLFIIVLVTIGDTVEDTKADALMGHPDQQTVVYKTNDNSHKPVAFPIIHDTEIVERESTKVKDRLVCRDSVIAFVINATDAKDECDGLKKAFDKTCNSDSTEAIINGKPSTSDSRPQQIDVSETTRTSTRRLLGLFENENDRWRLMAYQLTKWFRDAFRLLLRHRSEEFYAEDAVYEFWEEANQQVQFGVDGLLQHEVRNRLLRELQPEENAFLQVGPESITTPPSTALSSSAEQTLETETVYNESMQVKKVDKPKQSLTLPTKNNHVSNEMLSGTLLLQKEDTIKTVIAAAANHTNNTMRDAAVDAVVSAKAVQDTTAVVSALLNDPTSVEARTCCTSILNVFHENCDAPQEETVSDQKLFLIVFVIALCGMVKSLIRHFQIRWLPEAAGCILVGVFCGAVMSFIPNQDISFDGDWFLRIMVPPIVFEAALSIDKRSFNRHVVPIVIYAVGGTIMATIITAFIVHKGTLMLRGLCETIPYVESLTFGALISSIDPIAVLSVLNNMGMTDTDAIYVLIFGESLLNDGVAIVLFETLKHFLDESLVIDSEAVVTAAIHFFVVAFGSLFVGIGSGIVCTMYFWAMHGVQTALVEVLMFFCWAFIPYYICDGIGWSGIVSVVATGFVMDLFVVGQPSIQSTSESTHGDEKQRYRRMIFSKQGHLSQVARTHVGFVTEILATMMETAIFAYLGVFLFSYRYHWNFWHTVLAIIGCCVSRAIMVPSLSLLANWITRIQQIRQNCRKPGDLERPTAPAGVIVDHRMQLVLWFAGLRGAMSFALVENVPLYDTVTGEGSRLKPELKAMTSASIVFTVFVLGGYTYYMMDRVGMAPNRNIPSHETVSLIKRNLSSDAEDEPTIQTFGSPKTMRQRSHGSDRRV